MALNCSDIKKISHLARLQLDTNEETQITADINQTLQLIDIMKKVDTDKVELLAHPLENFQYLRADKVTEVNHRDTYQAIAPSTKDGLYLVPRVIE
ncbi:UNVERIFIED_CONTAM: hypothetical protein GTU68_006399 [Idotea baltica]|nr:hypothetical protein [Idotea baltica]